MSIEKFFEPHNYSSIVFDPIPAYSGEWEFGIENLLRNSKKEKGINLFQKFIEETYIKQFKKIFKYEILINMPIKLLSTPNDNNVGRCLKYSKTPLYSALYNFINQNIDYYGKNIEKYNAYLRQILDYFEDEEKLNEAFINALKEKLKRLKDVKDKGFNSDYHDAAMKDYDFQKKINPNLDFIPYIDSLYEMTQNYINGLMNLGDFFEQKIDYKELYNCFDPDTFYLLFAKIIYEVSIKSEKEYKLLDNSYCYLSYYNDIVGKFSKEEKKYDPMIKYTLDSGQRLRYTRRQFQNEFKALMERHPEAKVVALPNLDEVNDKYKDIDLMEKLSLIYGEETKVNWEFLPQGERIKKGQNTETKSVTTVDRKDKEDLVNETNMRISILENSGYIGTPVKGLDTFTGYYAFIYSNGKVILEKFWEDEEGLKPAVGCATYVMDIDNFIKLSKMSKINLVEYIKTFPEAGVKRIFHTSINNWQRNLNKEIEGTYRLEDAINFINGLKSGELNHEQ